MENKEFWTEFLKLYEDHPILWDKNMQGYSNNFGLEKTKALNVLVDKLKTIEPNADITLVRKKINAFRTSYRRDVLKIKASKINGASAESIFKSKLWYFDLLHFLHDEEISQSRDEKIIDFATQFIKRRGSKPCDFGVIDPEQEKIKKKLINDIAFYASRGQLKYFHVDVVHHMVKCDDFNEVFPDLKKE